MSVPPKPEDWLPHEPPPAPKPHQTIVNTVVTWLVLVFAFVVIYSMFTSDAPNAPESERAGYSGWWIAAGVLITLGVVALLVLWLFGSAAKFNTAQADALQALANGKYHESATMFEQLAHRYRARPNLYSVARYNQGYALLRTGDTAAAVGFLLAVDRVQKVGLGGIKKVAAVQIARCFALAGDLEKANRWLDAARQRKYGMADPLHDRALVEAVEGLVLCREGKLDQAARVYDAAWSRFTTYLSIDSMIEIWLLRAYAASAATTPRDAAAGEQWLRMLRGTPPCPLGWLTARWPELETFVVTHGLGTQQAA